MMIADIEVEYDVMTALEKIEAAALFADYRARAEQLIKSYRDHQLRSQANRKAERSAFRKSSDGIRRNNRGWSAISDRELAATSYDERERARKARNKRNQRARKAKPATPAPAIAPVVITREGFKDWSARLRVWMALPGHRQRHLRGREADIMRAWIVYHTQITRYGRGPTLAQFAVAFTARFGQPMTRQMAQNRLTLLKILMGTGAPFAVTF